MPYSNKKVYINKKLWYLVPNTLRTVGGYGESVVRTQMAGNSVDQVPYRNLENAKSQVNFDVFTLDKGDITDIKREIQSLKQNLGSIAIFIEADGVGLGQQYSNMTLINDPEIMESTEGTISFSFEGAPVQLV